jgi:hypothetical protein
MSFSRTEEISPVVGDSKGDRKALETLDLNKVCKVFVLSPKTGEISSVLLKDIYKLYYKI